MSKALKTVGTIVAAAALVATGVGAAVGGGILLGVSGATFTAVGAIAGAVGAGLSVAGNLLAKPPTQSAQGSQTQVKIDKTAGVPYAIGRTFVGGNVVHTDTYSTDNQYDSYVIVYSGGGPHQEIESRTIDRTPVAFSGTAATGSYSGWLWLNTQLGATPEAGALTAPASGFPSWSSAHKLSGYSAGLLTYKFDSKGKAWPSGQLPVGVVGKWAKVYDPRLDSTYPGGSGSCRALEETTYVWSENPHLHALTWALGRWQNGKRVLGIGAPADLINIDSYVEAANVADANGWTTGGVVSSVDAKWNVLKAMTQAGGGVPVPGSAKLSVLVAAPRVPLRTITEADLADGRVLIPGTQPRRSRINGVVPVYRSEAHGWEQTPADLVQVESYVTVDGGERTKEVDYPLVQDVTQASQLGAYEIFDARELGPIVLPLKPFAVGFRIGDCLTLDLPSYGLNEQDAIVIARGFDPRTGEVTLTFRGETPDKHAVALALEGTAPPTPSLTVDDSSEYAAPEEADWSVTPATVTSGDVEQPILLVAGTVARLKAEAVVFESQIDGEVDWNVEAIAPPDTVRYELRGLAPNTAYRIAIRYRLNGRDSDRLVLGPETTGNLLTGLEAALEAAAELAAGKSAIFYQDTPPEAADSSLNDLWIDTDSGNKSYQRLAGNGRIAYGSDTVVYGAQGAVVYAPWAPADDQRIAQALVDAAGAQATADRKVITFSQEDTPTAEGIGDLWYQPSTQSLKRWSGSGWFEVSTVGATPEQITLITEALTAADNAQATADGKIQSFYQNDAPTSFGEGDYWTDTNDSNKLYRASANSGDGGSWVAIRDSGIGQAIADAADAQATADGKITTFVATSAPTAEATGDLWYNTTTGELKRWDGDSWESTADNTALQQPSVTGPTLLSFSADYTGTLDPGQTPRTALYKRLLGTTDVTASATWSILSSDGVSVSIGSSDGIVSVTAISKKNGSYVVRSSYGGVTRDALTQTQRNDAPPPVNTGGGGGGGNPGTSGSVNVSLSTTSTTYGTDVSATFTCVAGTAGEVALSAALDVSLYAASGTHSQFGYAKWQWRAVGGSWADVSSETASSTAATYSPTLGGESAMLDLGDTKTGLTSGTTYEFRVAYRKGSGTSGQTMSFTGIGAGVGS